VVLPTFLCSYIIMNDYLNLETVEEGAEWWVFKTRAKINRGRRLDDPLTRTGDRNTVPAMDTSHTTVPGYINRNGQRVVQATESPGTDHNQRVYLLHCGHCGTEYGANGTDIFQHLCPNCQGGAPGCATN
jgi:hypothetical protein